MATNNITFDCASNTQTQDNQSEISKNDDIQLEQFQTRDLAAPIDAKLDHVPESGLAQLTHWQASESSGRGATLQRP